MITRGTFSGNGRFKPYGIILAAEGLIRIVPVIILYAAGVDELLWYGLCFAIPPALASLVALAEPARAPHPGTGSAVVRAVRQPLVAVRGIRALAAAELLAGRRRARARERPGPARHRRRLHRRLLHRPHPDPAVPGGAGRPAPPAGRARGREPHRRLPRRTQEAARDRRRDRHARRDRRRRARLHRRPDPVRRQVHARQRRPGAARGGQRTLRAGADAGAGPHRADGPPPRDLRLDRRQRRCS